MIRINFCFSLLLALLIGSTVAAQSVDWKLKVDPILLQHTEGGAQAEMLVILTEQADLSGAKLLHKKDQKGAFVYKQLHTLAENTQQPVKEVLDNFQVPYRSFWIINAFWAKGARDLVEVLASLPEVARVEFNPVWKMQRPVDEQETVSDLSATDRVLTPRSWGLTKIQANAVWDLGYQGSGVVIGGQDTGYEWEHPAIKSKYRGWNGSTVDHNYNWHDAIHSLINGGTNSCGLDLMAPCDDDGHGTHTMGTMTGSPNIDSIFGVAPEAKWMGCRNMEEGDGTPATYIECFEWFIAPKMLNGTMPNTMMAPHVINNSWGCPTTEGCNGTNFVTMDGVVNSVRAAGILVVVSAGNSGSGCSTVNTPAAIYTGSFSVGATNSSDVIANFSSRGPVTVYGATPYRKPDISAPGVSIPSSYGHDNLPSSYSYLALSGTSMAGPHVAGVAALIMNARPDFKGEVDILEYIIENWAVELFDTAPFCGGDTSTTTPNNVYGHGRVNVLAAVNAALVLPVDFVQFTAKKVHKTAKLEWTTAKESNCVGYDIQRSADGFTWEVIDKIPCKNSVVGNTYSYIDEKPLDGVSYYRLKQLDISGEFLYSNAVALSFSDSEVDFSIIPQPSINSAFVALAGNTDNQPFNFGIYGIDGRFLLNFKLTQSAAIALPSLPFGVYVGVLKDQKGKVMAVKRWVYQ